MFSENDFLVEQLGECRFESPLKRLLDYRQHSVNYVEDTDRILVDNTASALAANWHCEQGTPGLEPAGARRNLFFDPDNTRVGIVTCGGLCPGLNNVIRSLVNEFCRRYGVERIYGFRNGYQGLLPKSQSSAITLTPETVENIHEHGGTVLGSSRGQRDSSRMVDTLVEMGINVLMVIGGDGTIRGAMSIADEVAARGESISVIGIPKTIDNDIMFADYSFGFQTAIEQGASAVLAAHVEACGAPMGVGLVKLMGRHSGFIACYASLAANDANFVLIPEVPFRMDGQQGLLESLRRRLQQHGNAVIVVAEGAGQDVMGDASAGTDASGNQRLGDIGVWLKSEIQKHFADNGWELNLKYIDPSYAIRSVPANPFDSVFCARLAHNAVHAAMSGRTKMVVSRWHTRFVHVPMSLAIRERNCVDPNGDLWMTVLESTGQPTRFQ